MTSIESLDRELELCEQELAELERAAPSGISKCQRQLLTKLQSIHSQQEELARLIEYARLAEATEVLLCPKARAMLFWAREYAERIEEFVIRSGDFLQKLLWLNLLRSRLLGKQRFFSREFAEPEVHAMLKRKRALEEVDLTLKERLRQLQQIEQNLRLRYQDHMQQRAAHEAALSFSTSSRSMLSQRAILESFGRLLRTVAAHSLHSPQEIQKLQHTTVSFTRRSQELMEQCSELLRRAESEARRSSLIDKLGELRNLEAEIDTALRCLHPESPPTVPLLMVKKVPKGATTALQTNTKPFTGAIHGQ